MPSTIYRLLCAACLAFTAVAQAADRPDLLLGDFEAKTLAPWTATGDAFSRSPFRPAEGRRFQDYQGAGLAWTGRTSLEQQGLLLSPEFTIERRYLNFLVAGHRDLPRTIGVELLLDGRVVRSAAASEYFDPERKLYPRTFHLGELQGRQAQLRVNDRSPYGAIAVDHFIQSDQPATQPADATHLLDESWRPQFHYTARVGWLNDPNGLLYYRGQWHLFHQHRYPGVAATVWAHATSPDLFHWKHCGVAIPAEGQDAIFSGTGLVDWANASGLKQGDDAPLLLFYTLHPAAPPRGSNETPRRATQCLAYSIDGGRTFSKYAGNPILQTPDFNDRDPKVFYHAPSHAWFMVLSLSRNNLQRDRATYGVFRARGEPKQWKLIQELGPGAWYWECPDLFELPIDGDWRQTKWLLVKGSGEYIVGTLDVDGFRPETEPIRNRWGKSYYGTQTFSDAPDRRRIQIAWMNTDKPRWPNSYPGMPFNQQMSVPRELFLRRTSDGPRLFRSPAAEISGLWRRVHEHPAGRITPGENPLAGIGHDLLDLECELEIGQARELRLNLRGEELVYDAANKKLTGLGGSAPLAPRNGRLRLRVLLDRASIEVFANDGEVDLSGVFYPQPVNRSLSLGVTGGPAKIHRLVVRELTSVW